MSRGFVKESDQEEPIVIPPRASLPAGQTNYVTRVGKDLLEQERKDLEHQRATLSITDDTERRREITKIDGQLQLLQERLNTAQVIDLKDQPQHEVRFGAQVKFKLNGTLQNFQLVGVDEANVKAKKIAFTSPLARALTSRTQGEQFNFKLGTEQRPIEILDINYTV
jgi:transcription elongation factor GreB